MIDYLPDRWVYRLVLSCFEELADDGCIVLSSVLSSEHDAVCTALFQWYMVRRSEQDLRQLFSSMGVGCELHIGQHAIVSVLVECERLRYAWNDGHSGARRTGW